MSEPDGEGAKRETEPVNPEPVTGEPVNREEDVERFLAWSLRLAYIPVAVLLLAGLGAFVYGTALFIHSVGLVVDHPFPIRHQMACSLKSSTCS